MSLAITTLIAGIAVGSVYALIATCYSIVFLGTRVFNLAQGDIVVMGLVVSYFLLDVYHLPQIVTLVCAVAATTLFSVLEERLIIRRFLKLGSAGFGWFIGTLGLALVLETIWAILMKSQNPVPIPSPLGSKPLHLGSVSIEPDFVLCIAVTLVLVVAVALFYSRTYIGTSMRATAEDRDLAGLRGIKPGQVSMIAFAMAGVISGLAGYVLAPIAQSDVSIGLTYGLFGFIGLAIGGFGSLPGALIGGWLVGIGQQVFDVYINPNYDLLAGLILLLVVLSVRPTGLLSSRSIRTV